MVLLREGVHERLFVLDVFTFVMARRRASETYFKGS